MRGEGEGGKRGCGGLGGAESSPEEGGQRERAGAGGR